MTFSICHLNRISPKGIILNTNQAFASGFNKTREKFFCLIFFDFLPPEV